jgi:tRNA threonylcarbamoyladenosine biosynthesis protein TsaE
MILRNNSLKNLKNITNIIKDKYWHHKIFLLRGTLGVGKTQFIKYILEDIVKEEIKSPTFSILNKYTNISNNKINYWHFDLYKKQKMDLWEMEELGFYMFLENLEDKIFIEWPERLSFPLLGLNLNFMYDHINIENNNSNDINRIIEIKEG